MPRRRDRHQRGLRGPLALANPLTGYAVQPVRPTSRTAFFTDAVEAAIDQIGRNCPDALNGVAVGIEDVPHLATAWSGAEVPLAAALEADPLHPARVVVYRRPLEHRAASRRGLRILVYRTIVEQLSALTGRSIAEIDPTGLSDDE